MELALQPNRRLRKRLRTDLQNTGVPIDSQFYRASMNKTIEVFDLRFLASWNGETPAKPEHTLQPQHARSSAGASPSQGLPLLENTFVVLR